MSEKLINKERLGYYDGKLKVWVGSQIENATQGKADKATTYTKTEVDEAIKTKIAALGSVFNYKGAVANYAALPAKDQKTGDVWHVTEKSAEYVWDGTRWEELGSVVDVEGAIVLKTIKVNGDALTPDESKAVDVTVTSGATNGAIAVNGKDIKVAGLKSAAYTDSSAYATAAQGAKADTALQPADMEIVSEADIDALFA